MATTKLGNTKSASRAINYAEKRAEEKSGLNCDIDYAKSSFKQTRALYGKEIAKYCNQHQHEAPNYIALEENVREIRERLDEIWQQLK